MTGAPAKTDPRPLLAMVTGHLAPYRVHLNRRIAREFTEMRLATVVTKNRSTMWKAEEIPEIGTVLLDRTDRDWYNAPWIPYLLHERHVAQAVTRWLDTNRPAAVITAGYDEIPVNAAVSWARRNRVPVFLAADSNVRSDRATGVKRAIKRVVVPRLVRRFTGIMPFGAMGKEYFAKYGGDPRSFFAVPLEPDYSIIQTMTAERAAALSAEAGAPIDPARKRVICCGRLVPDKRVDLAIGAFRTIAAERPDWDLLIVGDGPLRGDLERQAGDLVGSGRIRFLGFQDQEHVTALYHTSHVLVLSSEYEPWALVVNEAACAGCALVVTDAAGAAPELVRDGESGFVFPSGDAPALADRLRRATDPASTERLRAGARRVLAEWRTRADPIRGIRAAMRWCGAIGGGGAAQAP